MTRAEKILEGAAYWGAFYRENVDKFVEDYLHIRLKLFQRIVLVMMFWSTTFVWIAARGLGKTYLSAVYCVCRSILYPGTKVCIASGTRGQAMNVLEKIMLELLPNSSELRAEIDEKQTKINGTNAQVVFKNTSAIKVVTASDSARGNRCHVLLLDEFRLIRKDTIDTVLRKFLTLRRMPRYDELTEDERKKEYNKEKNLTMYLSSAYWKDHWSYIKCVDACEAMTKLCRRQFVCGFPYQLSIAEGLLDPEAVADEMEEQNFSDIKFSMEMGAEFFGSADGAFFEYDSISKNRHIKYPMLPERLSSKIGVQTLRIPSKQNGELRILSADIALMSSRKNNNDATAIFINQMMPTKAGRYTNNIVYAAAYEGLRTDDQALIIRKLFDEYHCDYIVLDASGSNARQSGDTLEEARKKTGTLRCESEWKDGCNGPFTRNAYGLKLLAEYNVRKSPRYLTQLIEYTGGMLLLKSKTAIVVWNSKNKKRYVDKGYRYTKMGDSFEVDICDLTTSSVAQVEWVCDYCGNTYTSAWNVYNSPRKRNCIVQKDACANCLELKAKDSIEEKYGSYSNSYFAGNEKRKETNINRYGSENPFGSDEIKKRIVELNMMRYGVPYSQMAESVRSKTVKTCRERYGVDNYVELFRGKFIGKNSPCWKDDVEYERHERATHEYISWRSAVFTRDEYTCQNCGSRNGAGRRVTINAHHIDNWRDNPDLRYDVNNGITLCSECHVNFHSKYGKRHNTREQLMEFLSSKYELDKKVC